MTTPNGNIKKEQKNDSKPNKQHKNIFYKFFHQKKSQKVTNSCKETKVSPSCNFCESLPCVTQSRNKNHNIDTNIEVSIGDESTDLLKRGSILLAPQQSTNTSRKAKNLFFESLSCHNLDSTEQSTLPLQDDSFRHEGITSFKVVSAVEPIKHAEFEKGSCCMCNSCTSTASDGFVKIEATAYRQLLEDLNHLKTQLTNLQFLIQSSSVNATTSASTDTTKR